MVQIILIGIGAGAAAALLFASVASGAILSTFLFYLAPLPIMIAALGWSHWAGMLGALTAAAGLAVVLHQFFFLAFLFGVGAPGWWLGYLALLARPAENTAEAGLEWYPPGRLVFWAAILGALVIVAAIPQFGTDEISFRDALKSGLERVFRVQTGTLAGEPLQLPGLREPNMLFDFLALVIPPAAAAVTTSTLAFNLWLAGRVVKMSGRLLRPWPDLAAMKLPSYAPGVLAAAVAGSFMPGLAGVVAGLFAATLLLAYAMLGFAVLHALTRAVRSRAVALAGVYGAVAVFGWPLLLITLLGLADAAFDLRRRAAKPGPPAGPGV